MSNEKIEIIKMFSIPYYNYNDPICNKISERLYRSLIARTYLRVYTSPIFFSKMRFCESIEAESW